MDKEKLPALIGVVAEIWNCREISAKNSKWYYKYFILRKAIYITVSTDYLSSSDDDETSTTSEISMSSSSDDAGAKRGISLLLSSSSTSTIETGFGFAITRASKPLLSLICVHRLSMHPILEKLCFLTLRN